MDIRSEIMRRNPLGDILRKNASRFPEKTAITCYLPGKSDGDGSEMTFKELNAAANRFARGVFAQGLKEGDVAAVFCHNCMEFMVIVWGLLKANITATFINTNYVEDELIYQVNHSDAKILFVDDGLIEIVSRSKDQMKQIQQFGYINLNNTPVPETWLNVEALYDEKYSAEELEIQIDSEDTAFRLYTSGTTSRPKGIDLSHSNLECNCRSWSGSKGVGIEFDSVMGMFLPLYHSGIVVPLSGLCVGAHLVLGSISEDPMGVLDILEKEKIEWTGFPVTLFARLIDSPLADKLKSVKNALWFGGAMPLGVLRKWLDRYPELTLIAQWSQTECLVGTNVKINRDSEFPKEGSIIGKPYQDTELKLVDENDMEVEAGTPGEIAMRSPAVMKGFYKNQEATEAAFKNGWHHTGDVAYRDETGMYFFVDRLKDMIKTGGVNVSPMEVEITIGKMEGIAEVAVFGVFHPDWIEAIAAAVVKKDPNLSEQDVIEYCKGKMANFKVPKKIIFLDQLPLSHIGKVLRKNLRETYQDLFTKAD